MAGNQQLLCKTLTGHTIFVQYSEKDSFEDVIARVSQKYFPSFRPRDGMYSHHLGMIFEGHLVEVRDALVSFEDVKRRCLDVAYLHLVPYSPEMKQHLYGNAEQVVADLNRHTAAPKATDSEKPVDAIRIVEQLLTFDDMKIQYNQAVGLSKHAPTLHALTTFSWVAFAGLVGGGAAWLSVASNLSAFTSFQPAALITVGAIAVLAIAALVFAALGTKACVSTNREIRRVNNLFAETNRFDMTEEEQARIPVAEIAPDGV